MEVAAAAVWEAKLGAVAIGLALVALGLLMWRYGSYLTRAFNWSYSIIPGPMGRFRYPARYHQLFGSAIVAFGLLIAFVGGIFAK